MTSPEANSKPLPDKINDLLDNSNVEEGKKEELLQAMLGVARGIVDHPNGTTDLEADFENAFEGLSAEKVNLLLAYRHSTPTMIVGHPDIAGVLSNGHSGETGASRAVPPSILWKPSQ